MDFRVLSTLGLTEDDISKIRKVDGVKGVYPTHSIDVLTSIKSDEYVLKVFGLPINNISVEESSSFILSAKAKAG